MTQYRIYQIHISGLLDPSWSDWFDGLAITYLDDDTTILTGPLIDQAALHGALNKIRDLGLILLSVSPELAVHDNQHKS